jgi:Bacterial Ig-like domain
MNQVAKNFSLSACALAASLLISACGGGALSTDTTPPTVSITSSAGTAAGTVAFTFTFSEELSANTFTAEDVVITGGAAGAFTKIDATHYTLQVVPSASNVTASVASSKFDDLAHNFNTVPASGTYTVAAGVEAALVTFEENVSPKLTGFGGAEDASVVADPAGGTGKVAKVVKSATAELWAGTTVSTGPNDSIATIAFTESAKTMTVRVWAPATGIPVRLKVENAADNTKTVETEAVTTVANAWQTMTFNFASQASGTAALNLDTVYNKASIFFNFGKTGAAGGGGTYYFDDLTFVGGNATPKPTPTPTGSTINFSASGIGFGVFENQGGGTVEIANDPTDAANKVVKFVKKSGDPEYFGTTITGLGGSVILTDASKTITMRVFSPAVGTNFLLKLEGGASGATTEKDVITTKTGEWETLSFVMPAAGTYSTVVVFPNGRSKVTTDTTIYIDDLTFPAMSSSSSTGGTTTGSTAFSGGIFSAEYSGNLAIAGSAKSNLGGDVGFYFDPRLASTKLYDFGGFGTLAENPGGVPNFYYGLGLNKPAITDAYFGAFVNSPGNAAVDVSGFTNVLLKFWGPAELFEKGFTPAVRILLTGPVVSGCGSDSGRSEIQATVNGLKIGAGSSYSLPLSSFTTKFACSGETSAAQVLSKVAQVHFQLVNANIQYSVADTGTPVAYPNGLNIGPIKFN